MMRRAANVTAKMKLMRFNGVDVEREMVVPRQRQRKRRRCWKGLTRETEEP